MPDLPQLSADPRVLEKAAKYKWLLFPLGAALALGPVAGLIIAGVQAIIWLGAFALGAYTVVYYTPVLAMKLANWRLKALLSEAANNPILTLKNEYATRVQQLQAADNEIVDFSSEVRTYDDQLRDFKRQYPDEADSFQEVSDKMHVGLKDMTDEQGIARAALQDLKGRINKAEAIYNMALAAEKVSQLSQDTEGRVFSEIKQKVAFDAVRASLNHSFAALDRAVAKRQELTTKAAGKQLTS
jgi:hypothetical protein